MKDPQRERKKENNVQEAQGRTSTVTATRRKQGGVPRAKTLDSVMNGDETGYFENE